MSEGSKQEPPLPARDQEPPLPARDQEPPLPAAVQHNRRFQLIWLIPIVAVAVAAWLGFQALEKNGPVVTLSFRSADGLVAGQTRVRHKAVDLGTVDTITLSPDLSHVVVTVRMQRAAADELTASARFWVVRPRLTAGNISGLDTVLSGAYIELDPGVQGSVPADRQYDFTGLDEPPAVRSDEPGLSYVLQASRIGGITSGSPVLYRDITVGEVLRYELSPDGQGFTVSIFVRKPYDRFVREGTHFWNASGVGLDLGANGVQLRLQSLQALVSGAVAFDTTPDARATPVSVEGTQFHLFHDAETAASAGYKKRLHFITHIDSSVRGLAVGAPVEAYGIKIGSVSDIHLVFDPAGSESHVDVRFEIQPERILPDKDIDSQSPFEVTKRLVARGMRVQLHTASYITGQLVLSMDFIDGAKPAEATQMADGTMVVPSVSGGLSSLTANLADLSAKLSRIPFDQIGADLQTTLHGASAIANGPELTQSLQQLRGTLASAQELVRSLNSGIEPLIKRLPEIAQNLQATLGRTQTLVASADAAYGGHSQTKRDLDRLLAQLSDTARSVRLLADYLSQHPESLIQGRTGRASER